MHGHVRAQLFGDGVLFFVADDLRARVVVPRAEPASPVVWKRLVIGLRIRGNFVEFKNFRRLVESVPPGQRVLKVLLIVLMRLDRPSLPLRPAPRGDERLGARVGPEQGHARVRASLGRLRDLPKLILLGPVAFATKHAIARDRHVGVRELPSLEVRTRVPEPHHVHVGQEHVQSRVQQFRQRSGFGLAE